MGDVAALFRVGHPDIVHDPIFQECRDLGPAGSVVWQFNRRYLKPPHYHGQLEVLFVKCGQARLLLGTDVHELSAGTLAWILPGTTHHVFDFSADYDMWVAHCEPEFASRAFADKTLEESLMVGEQHCLDCVRPVVTACRGAYVSRPGAIAWRDLEEMCAVAHAGELEPGSAPLVTAVLRSALSATLDVRIDGKPSLTDWASALVAEDLELSRDALCERLQIGRAHLSRLSKRAWGHGFVEMRARSRIATFLALCRSAEANLLEAGLHSGFGSYSQLHRTFSKMTGFRPRDYVLGQGRSELAALTD